MQGENLGRRLCKKQTEITSGNILEPRSDMYGRDRFYVIELDSLGNV